MASFNTAAAVLSTTPEVVVFSDYCGKFTKPQNNLVPGNVKVWSKYKFTIGDQIKTNFKILQF